MAIQARKRFNFWNLRIGTLLFPVGLGVILIGPPGLSPLVVGALIGKLVINRILAKRLGSLWSNSLSAALVAKFQTVALPKTVEDLVLALDRHREKPHVSVPLRDRSFEALELAARKGFRDAEQIRPLILALEGKLDLSNPPALEFRVARTSQNKVVNPALLFLAGIAFRQSVWMRLSQSLVPLVSLGAGILFLPRILPPVSALLFLHASIFAIGLMVMLRIRTMTFLRSPYAAEISKKFGATGGVPIGLAKLLDAYSRCYLKKREIPVALEDELTVLFETAAEWRRFDEKEGARLQSQLEGLLREGA